MSEPFKFGVYDVEVLTANNVAIIVQVVATSAKSAMEVTARRFEIRIEAIRGVNPKAGGGFLLADPAALDALTFGAVAL